VPGSSKWLLFFRCSEQNSLHFLSLPCMLHALPISLSWFDHPNNMWWVQIMKLRIIQLSKAFHYFPHRFKYSLKHPWSMPFNVIFHTYTKQQIKL
jgi:hypothetical protein